MWGYEVAMVGDVQVVEVVEGRMGDGDVEGKDFIIIIIIIDFIITVIRCNTRTGPKSEIK